MIEKEIKNNNKSRLKKVFNNIIEEYFKPYLLKIEEKKKKVLESKDLKKIYLLHGETLIIFKAAEDTKPFEFSHSIPLVYGNQVPILFKIKEESLNNIIKYSILDDKNPPNKKINFKIVSMKKNKRLTINFEYWVLVKNKNFKDLPSFVKIPKVNKLPKETKIWLKSSKSIQSKNFLIKIKAFLLKRFEDNLIKLGKRLVLSSCYHRVLIGFSRLYIETTPTLHNLFLPDRYWTGLNDAISCYLFGGLCGAKANYEVALFRAKNVPARVLTTTTMFYGKKLWSDAQHFIIEFFCPNYGWITAMSGKMPYQPKNFILLRLNYLEDENIAGNGLSYYGGIAPWFWVENKNISLDFPETLINYGKLKGEGVPAVRGWIENKVTVDRTEANNSLNLTKNVWDYFTSYVGKKMSEEKNKYFANAIIEQKKAIKFLKQSNIKKYMEHMNNALNNYIQLSEKIKVPNKLKKKK